MKRLLIPLTVLAASALVGLAIVEGVLRLAGFQAPIWYGPDERLGWSLRPGAQGWHTHEGRGYVSINSAGQRDHEHPIEKPPGVYRVAVLGDSYAEAMQVNEDQTFWHVLEGKLSQCWARPVEVVNFGVSGYGTAQEYLLLESAAPNYRPDLVLLAFTNGNDLRNNSRTLEPEKDRPFFRLDGDGLAVDTSFVRSKDFVERSSAMTEFNRRLSDHVRLAQLGREARNILTAWRARNGAVASSSAP